MLPLRLGVLLWLKLLDLKLWLRLVCSEGLWGLVENLRHVLGILQRRLPVRGPIRRGQDALIEPGFARPLCVPGRETAQARCHAPIRGIHPRVRRRAELLAALLWLLLAALLFLLLAALLWLPLLMLLR